MSQTLKEYATRVEEKLRVATSVGTETSFSIQRLRPMCEVDEIELTSNVIPFLEAQVGKIVAACGTR